VDDGGGLEATAHANAAREHVFGFNRITMWERDRIPAETSAQLAEFADIAAALPPACSQLSSTLEQALASQKLSMDSMTDESDPSMAIGVTATPSGGDALPRGRPPQAPQRRPQRHRPHHQPWRRRPGVDALGPALGTSTGRR